MKHYNQLGHVYRTEPCVEYPGTWLVFQDGVVQVAASPTFDEALTAGRIAWDKAADGALITICWQCSDNDPRVGQVWFTGFYQHGKFNTYGSYIQ
jgi:hypothetical protein